jgi:UDP-3-O-[3-hydroxymyristoyl] glucosamine N-acyltransferase
MGLDYTVEGNNVLVKDVSTIKHAKESDLSFCYYTDEYGLSLISKSNAGIIICDKKIRGQIHPKNSLQQFIYVDTPRLVFVRIFDQIQKSKNIKHSNNVSPKALISKSSSIGQNCYIGDFSKIGDNCHIGDNNIIENRVSISNCLLGNNCIIQSGVTIGEDGFGFERNTNGDIIRFPHIGKVIIQDNVEISSNSSISRGTLSNTVIGKGSKIGDLVMIGHNVEIGTNCIVVSSSSIGGSTIIGNMSWIGLNSTIKDGIKIGNNVLTASGSSVIENVEDKDIVAGNPAKSIKHKINNNNLLFMMIGQK